MKTQCATFLIFLSRNILNISVACRKCPQLNLNLGLCVTVHDTCCNLSATKVQHTHSLLMNRRGAGRFGCLLIRTPWTERDAKQVQMRPSFHLQSFCVYFVFGQFSSVKFPSTTPRTSISPRPVCRSPIFIWAYDYWRLLPSMESAMFTSTNLVIHFHWISTYLK